MLAATYRLAAVTDTSVMTAADVRAALDRSGFEGLLDPIATSVDMGAAKPDPRGLLWVLDQLGLAPAEALFVGDAEVDREAAEAAGVAFIQVLTAPRPILRLVERFVPRR